MIDVVETIPVQRVSAAGKRESEETIVSEFPLTIILNSRELVTLLCSPADLDYMALGFLASEGLLRNKADIKNVLIDSRSGVVRVETVLSEEAQVDFKRFITSGCGRGASFYSAVDVAQGKIGSLATISAGAILSLLKAFQVRSKIYRTTGGVHGAALCDSASILIFKEDIGRHNAIDKVFGECLMKAVTTEDRVVVTSGRVSSDIVLKVARRQVPVLISRSAPTGLAVRLANNLGITLVGFARAGRMNVYTNSWRITADDSR